MTYGKAFVNNKNSVELLSIDKQFLFLNVICKFYFFGGIINYKFKDWYI